MKVDAGCAETHAEENHSRGPERPRWKPLSDTAKIESYHAHVYYSGASSRAAAASLREALQERFEVAMGNWRDQPVGPHPLPMYQVSFAAREFARVVPWLMLNHDGPLDPHPSEH